MNKHFLFIAVIVMAMTVPFASAKQIGPQQALEIARQFSTTDTKLKSMSASPAQMKVVYTAKPEGSPADSDDNGLLYVVSSGDNAGYVMVAGDDVVSNPVLGYSTGGEFDYSPRQPQVVDRRICPHDRICGRTRNGSCRNAKVRHFARPDDKNALEPRLPLQQPVPVAR